LKRPTAKLDRIEEARASIAEFHQLDNEKADPAVFVNCQVRNHGCGQKKSPPG
jgi:hypothetical protein